jgi:hypothetical protein
LLFSSRMTYEPKFVALCAFAFACFSVGFTVTAVAYAAQLPGASGEAHASARPAPERVASAASKDGRGCNVRRQ